MFQVMWTFQLLGHRLLSHQNPILKHYGLSPMINRWPHWGEGFLPRCWDAVYEFYNPSWQGNAFFSFLFNRPSQWSKTYRVLSLTLVCWPMRCCYVSTQPLHHEQDVIQGQFLSVVQLVWIQNITSSRPVFKWRLKNPAYPTI